MTVNEDKLNELLGKGIIDFGATFHAALAVIGDKLGLYRAVVDGEPISALTLAECTGTASSLLTFLTGCTTSRGKLSS